VFETVTALKYNPSSWRKFDSTKHIMMIESGTIENIDLSNGQVSLPEDYTSYLSLRETQDAIEFIKDSFQSHLSEELDLTRVSAPLIVRGDTGVNDHLNGVEEPVSFASRAEIVQSLAKWKRMALADYGFHHGEGIYTDMNALRPDEHLDNLHSIYVDQWDWERVIAVDERNHSFLKKIVRNIYSAIYDLEQEVCETYPHLPEPSLPNEITFIHSEDLRRHYQDLSPAEREHKICRKAGAVFIIGIGGNLGDGSPHDLRAADYDDWITGPESRQGLNGDIIIWNPLLNSAFELSSMGIRVDAESLKRQLEIRGEPEKQHFYFHWRLLNGELPMSIGGGIGQSRLCMFLLRKAHIGEVQSSIWHDEMKKVCEQHNIFLL